MKHLLLITAALAFQAFANDAGQQCDALTTYVGNPDKPAGVAPVNFDDIDTQRAIPICQQAVKDNPTMLRYQFNLARALDSSGDIEAAITRYQQLVEQDYAVAKNNLGLKYYDGEGVEESAQQALKYYQEGANLGSSAAYYNWANYQYGGKGGLQASDSKAFKLFLKSAELGESCAYSVVGQMYADGEGVEQSVEKAKLWLEKE